MERKKVLILSAPEGHASLARAVKSLVEDLGRVEIVDLIGGFRVYRLFYRFAPSLFYVPWKWSQKDGLLNLYDEYANLIKRRSVEEVVLKMDPDLIVTTHYLYLPILIRLGGKRKWRHINVVSDPVDIHPLIYAREADYNVGFGKEFVETGLQVGVEKKRLVEVGWLVEEEFYRDFGNRELFLRKLGFDSKKLVVLVCGGSEGTNAILNTLPVLFKKQYTQQVQVVFITGRNRQLKSLIKNIYRLGESLGKKMPKIRVVGFTRRMVDYVRAADVVVGKAGPNLLFESVAARKPFVAVTHISGQESGNLKLIERENIGWVAEEREVFGNLFERIVFEKGFLESKQSGLERLARRNLEGTRKFRGLVKELMSQ